VPCEPKRSKHVSTSGWWESPPHVAEPSQATMLRHCVVGKTARKARENRAKTAKTGTVTIALDIRRPGGMLKHMPGVAKMLP